MVRGDPVDFVEKIEAAVYLKVTNTPKNETNLSICWWFNSNNKGVKSPKNIAGMFLATL
jgi:hypothetical protein